MWPKRSATIYHALGLNGNWGDFAIAYAFRQHIERIAHPHELIFRYIDYQRQPFTDELIEEINLCADVLVIGPGGAVMNREHGPFQVQIDDWERIKVPIAVQSIGFNQFPYNDPIDTHHPSIVGLVARADLFSVRNTGTRKALHLSKRVPVIADPGLMIETERIELPNKGKFNVAVCLAGDRLDKRWATDEDEARFKARLGETLSWLVDEKDATVFWLEHLKDSANLEDASKFADQYRQMDLVLGMRKHSVLIPYSQYVPTIALGDQSEVRWFLEDLGTTEYRCGSHNPDEMIPLCKRILERKDEWVRQAGKRKTQMKSDFWASLWRILRLAGVVQEQSA